MSEGKTVKEILAEVGPEGTLDEQIACIKGEIAKRKNYYPYACAQGKMKLPAARLEIARMTAALHTLMGIKSENDHAP